MLETIPLTDERDITFTQEEEQKFSSILQNRLDSEAHDRAPVGRLQATD